MKPACAHFREANIQGGGLCAIGNPQGDPPIQPAYRWCRRCPYWKGPAEDQLRFLTWYEQNRPVEIRPPAGSAEAEAIQRATGNAPCQGCP